MTYRRDPELGQRILALLQENKLDAPALSGSENAPPEQADAIIQDAVLSILRALNLNPEDTSLRGTPERVSRMYRTELFAGLDYSNFPACTIQAAQTDEVVICRGIRVRSFCEHHLLPIDGVATVGYIPKNRLLGLSKLNRIVDFFSRRPQVQERLTQQVHLAVEEIVESRSVAVAISARHFCIQHRGVSSDFGSTITSKLSGDFLHDSMTRTEFFALSKEGAFS